MLECKILKSLAMKQVQLNTTCQHPVHEPTHNLESAIIYIQSASSKNVVGLSQIEVSYWDAPLATWTSTPPVPVFFVLVKIRSDAHPNSSELMSILYWLAMG